MRDQPSSTTGPDSDHTHSSEDVDLVYQAQRGCSDCLTILFRRYHKFVLFIALRVLRAHSEAEDVVQDVFLSILLQSNAYEKTKGSVRKWIAQLAYFKALVRRRHLLTRKLTILDEVVVLSGEGSGFEPQLRSPERIRLVEECLASLKPQQRRAIELIHFEGYTLLEAASVLQQTLANTRNQYYRGIQALRMLLRFRKPAKDLSAAESKSVEDSNALSPFLHPRSFGPELED